MIVGMLAGIRNQARWFARVACAVLAVNFAILAIRDSYDIRVGGLHLVAHGLFKPLLLMNGAFLLACLLAKNSSIVSRDVAFVRGIRNQWLFCVPVIALAVLAHWQSLTIDFLNPDWNHEDISGAIHRFRDAWGLFSQPQVDGFYRPMTFLSLWGDYSFFRNAPLAYH